MGTESLLGASSLGMAGSENLPSFLPPFFPARLGVGVGGIREGSRGGQLLAKEAIQETGR